MKKTKILVAEDDEMTISLLSFRLRKEGYEVIAVTDGKAALEKINTEEPDLIITDIMMPHVTGLEIIDYVQKKIAKKIPVIILSGAGQEDTVMEAFNLGADEFITKPLRPDELLQKIKDVMG